MKLPWKYVIVEHEDMGIPIPVLLPSVLEHKMAARAGRQGKAISAGFCAIDTATGVISVWGESVSLGIKSRPEDAEALRMWFLRCRAEGPPEQFQSPKEGAQT
jgi:hypothetical protein